MCHTINVAYPALSNHMQSWDNLDIRHTPNSLAMKLNPTCVTEYNCYLNSLTNATWILQGSYARDDLISSNVKWGTMIKCECRSRYYTSLTGCSSCPYFPRRKSSGKAELLKTISAMPLFRSPPPHCRWCLQLRDRQDLSLTNSSSSLLPCPYLQQLLSIWWSHLYAGWFIYLSCRH